MLEKLAKDITSLTSDYHSDYNNRFVMTEEHVLDWSNQFEETDREFVLNEVLHILQQGVYISKEKAKEILWDFIGKAATFFGYQSIDLFLSETHFISSQAEQKSQTILLSILNDILIENTAYSIDTSGSLGIKITFI